MKERALRVQSPVRRIDERYAAVLAERRLSIQCGCLQLLLAGKGPSGEGIQKEGRSVQGKERKMMCRLRGVTRYLNRSSRVGRGML